MGLGDVGSRSRRAAEALRAVEAFFRDGDERQRDEATRLLAEDLDWVSLSAGDALFRQGDPSDAVYVVVGGRLRVFDEPPGAPARLLNEVGRGEMIGEMGVITGEPRSATVRAARDAELVRLPQSSFDRLLEQHPRAMMTIARALIMRLQRLQGRADHGARSASIAVVAAHSGVPLDDLCRGLAEALAAIGPARHLSSRAVDDRLGAGASQARWGDAEHAGLLDWLGAAEAATRYVVYQADAEQTEWTRRCVHQADRLLVVGLGGGAPDRRLIDSTLTHGDGAWSPPRCELVLLHHRDAVPIGTAAWLDALEPAAHHHLRLGSASDLARLARRITGHGVGLALGGGGARGMAHIGVIRAFDEEGIPIDVVGGASMGAFIASQRALGWDWETMAAANRELIGRARKLFDLTVPLVSFLAARRIDDLLEKVFGDRRIEDLWTTCFCVSCNLSRAELVVHQRGLVRRFVRASAALPGVLPPLCEAGELLVDGSVVNSVPIDVVRGLLGDGIAAGVDVSLDVFLDGDAQLAERYSGTQLLWQRLRSFGRRKVAHPGILSIMVRAAEVGSVSTRMAQKPSADIYVIPPLGSMSLFDTGRFDESVELGYRAGLEAIAEWRARGGAVVGG
jgi:predicted acylesterase/phospholipase RssA/CRP-like cAMP-binding protein